MVIRHLPGYPHEAITSHNGFSHTPALHYHHQTDRITKAKAKAFTSILNDFSLQLYYYHITLSHPLLPISFGTDGRIRLGRRSLCNAIYYIIISIGEREARHHIIIIPRIMQPGDPALSERNISCQRK